MVSSENPLGLKGIAFIQYSSQDAAYIDGIFKKLGMSRLMKHKKRAQYYYRQNNIHFLLDHAESGFERAFAEQHGHSVCAMGWRVSDAQLAFKTAIERGATAFIPGKYGDCSLPFPAISGIGDSIIYLVEDQEESYLSKAGFKPLEAPDIQEDKGFLFVDHLTNNVYKKYDGILGRLL